jgi:tRNA threonylcarbamoyladenosine biosynthesis protein TsaE
VTRVTEPELIAAGRALSHGLHRGAVVWLQGELGAGKTTLAQAIVEGRTGGSATSPTFSLVHRYGPNLRPVFHVDCYRLRSPEEAAELDWAELAAGDLLLIEWPERGGFWVPPPTVRVSLRHTDEEAVRDLAVRPIETPIR